MIDKTNITIGNKLTKKIIYYLNFDSGYWSKKEFDSRGERIYYDYGHISKTW